MKTTLSIIGIAILAIIGYLYYDGYRITKNENVYIVAKDENKKEDSIKKLSPEYIKKYEYEGHQYLQYGMHCIVHDPNCKYCKNDSLK